MTDQNSNHEPDVPKLLGTSRFRIPSPRPAAEMADKASSEAGPEESSAGTLPEAGETGEASSPTPVLPVSPARDAGLPLPVPDVADDVYTPAPASNPVVDALIANGLYLEAAGVGSHRLTCPWVSEHPPEASSQADYLEPDFGRPIGRFRCAHKHAEMRDAQCLIDHLGIGPDAARAKAVAGPRQLPIHAALQPPRQRQAIVIGVEISQP